MKRFLFRFVLVLALVFLPAGLLIRMLIDGAHEYWRELCDFYREVWSAFRKGERL